MSAEVSTMAVPISQTDQPVHPFCSDTPLTEQGFWILYSTMGSTQPVSSRRRQAVEPSLRSPSYPLGLRGDGFFAGFGPGTHPHIDAVMASGACAFASDAVEREVNPRLVRTRYPSAQVRAGIDHGTITFIRSRTDQHSEVNPLGFAANFAACEDSRRRRLRITVLPEERRSGEDPWHQTDGGEYRVDERFYVLVEPGDSLRYASGESQSHLVHLLDSADELVQVERDWVDESVQITVPRSAAIQSILIREVNPAR